MRLGLVLEQCLARVPGGTGRYSREIAAALARRAPAGSAVLGATAWHRDAGAAAVPGVEGPRRLPLGRRGLAAAWERGLGPAVPADVVHALTPLAPPRAGRLVVTVHDAVPWTHPQTLTPRGVRWHRAAVARAARDADLVVVPTRSVADELARHVPLREVLVVGHGVSPQLALPADAAERAVRLALPAAYLLTVATLEPRKGLSVLLEALAVRGAPDIPLLVVGQPGWGGVDVRAEADRLGLRDVRLLGRVADADLAVLLARATGVVVPSRAEGFGLPVLEAMAVATPVLVSPAPALVEVGGDAVLVAPDEELPSALARLVGDAALRARLAAAGPARAGCFSWDAAADALWSAYGALP